jgi:hypothetical protein
LEQMRRALLVLVAGLVVTCGGGAANQQAASPKALTYQQLAARPLKLPAISSGQTCPASPITLKGGAAPRIGTHVLFGFGTAGPQGGYAWNKTVWELPPSSSLPIVLLRGGRLDGSGTLYFDGQGIGPSDAKQVTVVDSRGGQTPFFSELRLPLDSNAAFYAYPTTAGCYAIQADSDSFSEVIVFPAS